MGVDGFHGFKDVPQAAFIEGAITDDGSLDLEDMVTTKGATVTIALANGKTFTLHEASYTGEGTGSTEEGEVGARFEGAAADEAR